MCREIICIEHMILTTHSSRSRHSYLPCSAHRLFTRSTPQNVIRTSTYQYTEFSCAHEEKLWICQVIFFVTSIYFMFSCSLSHSIKPHSRLFSLYRPKHHMIVSYSFPSTLQRSCSVFLTNDLFPHHVFSTPRVCSGRSRSYKYVACNSQSPQWIHLVFCWFTRLLLSLYSTFMKQCSGGLDSVIYIAETWGSDLLNCIER